MPQFKKGDNKIEKLVSSDMLYCSPLADVPLCRMAGCVWWWWVVALGEWEVGSGGGGEENYVIYVI